MVTQLLSEEERGRKKETDGSGKKISSEERRGGCNRVKKEEEDGLGIKRHQRAWEMVREGNGSDQFSHLLLLQFPQTTKCLQNPQLLLKKVGDRKAEPFSLGVPSFPSNKSSISGYPKDCSLRIWEKDVCRGALPSLAEGPPRCQSALGSGSANHSPSLSG